MLGRSTDLTLAELTARRGAGRRQPANNAPRPAPRSLRCGATIGIMAGLALVAALLNALFNSCLGCELYLLGKRVLAR